MASSALLRRWHTAGHKATLNGYGVMMTRPDPFGEEWIKAASALDSSSCCLELGAAFGVVTLASLRAGKQQVVANDLEQGHLDEITRTWEAEAKGSGGRLTTLQGAIPSVLRGWKPPCPLRAVLSANVLHFLTPEEVVETARLLYSVCEKGADLFLTLDSPWTTAYLPFWPLYGGRKLFGTPNPGFHHVTELLRPIIPARLHNIPVYHVMEPPALTALIEQGGWTVKKAEMFCGDQEGNPGGVNMVGSEMTGLHAVKAPPSSGTSAT
jgi:hypothetical protein